MRPIEQLFFGATVCQSFHCAAKDRVEIRLAGIGWHKRGPVVRHANQLIA